MNKFSNFKIHRCICSHCLKRYEWWTDLH